MEKQGTGEATPESAIAEPEVAGLEGACVSMEAGASFTSVTRSCSPEVMGQSGWWLEGLQLRLAGGNSSLEQTGTHLFSWGTLIVLSSVVCFLTPSSHLCTPEKKAVQRRSHSHASSLPVMRGRNSSFRKPGCPWASV